MLQSQLIRIRSLIPEPIKKILRLFKLYFDSNTVAPEIPQEQLEGCKVFQNRLNLVCSITNEKLSPLR